MLREHRDQQTYAHAACAWNPANFNARELAHEAKRGGYRYVVFTTRHHDGYAMWNTVYTDYSSAMQAPQRDIIREVVDAVRAEGLRVGLYYSLADQRLPAYWQGPEHNPEDWKLIVDMVHGQVRELLTGLRPY